MVAAAVSRALPWSSVADGHCGSRAVWVVAAGDFSHLLLFILCFAGEHSFHNWCFEAAGVLQLSKTIFSSQGRPQLSTVLRCCSFPSL